MNTQDINNPKALLDQIKQGGELFIPGISIDTVIFGYEENCLKVLLTQLPDNKWMLPGGYVLKEESLDEAAARNLLQRIGLSGVYCKQFYTFGDPKRQFTNEIGNLFQKLGIPWEEELWINNRFISVGYYALVAILEAQPGKGIFDIGCKWFSVDNLPELLLDHRDIVIKAHEQLQNDIDVFPIGFHFLAKEFTMRELQEVYQAVISKKVDRSRFQKKMFGYKVFERLEHPRGGVPHKRPFLYQYKMG
ncbi:NUDIX hydrolase [Muriicola sp. Z0-33]|uniref:NUDIX hydrolase n=1 Tax=Muriicola sp. Z0-33 TaxID=2816957 RepID=UPI0022376BC3|nr:NUDIX domain-containing protein [Muriicola sp. Z0-33]MCW5515297.1 NUDIX hydrolase [Muriicola sp. Z0-33]